MFTSCSVTSQTLKRENLSYTCVYEERDKVPPYMHASVCPGNPAKDPYVNTMWGAQPVVTPGSLGGTKDQQRREVRDQEKPLLRLKQLYLSLGQHQTIPTHVPPSIVVMALVMRLLCLNLSTANFLAGNRLWKPLVTLRLLIS